MSDFFEQIRENWYIIAAVAAFFLYFYKRESSRLEKWQCEYFDEILSPFHLCYINDSSINIEEFLNNIDIFEKGYTPSYLLYLTKNKQYEKIRKVLIVDYAQYHPSKKRIVLYLNDQVANALAYSVELISILLIASFLLVSGIIAFSLLGDLIIFLSEEIPPSSPILYRILLLVLFPAISYLFIIILPRFHDYSDCYSSSIKTVNNLINSKMNKYNKISKDLIYEYSQELKKDINEKTQ